MKRWYRRIHDRLFGADPIGATANGPALTEVMPTVGHLREGDGLEYIEGDADVYARETAKSLAEIEARTSAELDAIFGPLRDGIDDMFGRIFDQAEKAAGLGSGWVYGWYVDAVRRGAEAEQFAREITTGDIHATAEFDTRALHRMLTAGALMGVAA